MEARNETLKLHQHAGSIFRIWSAYWLDRELPVPPIHLLCPGVSGDLFFATGLGNSELSQFLNDMAQNNEFQFLPTGDWLLNPYEWFGSWSIFFTSPQNSYSAGTNP